ncbi:hypothetical protein OHA40_27485 [Nocardia sp. NBC_00508]|uniref:hypothetical protein n=1 Tax=Nocardia sp. NBC_00508 TaxID=2975992 RepID=UPI002E80ED9E|nr:hypothetical protein [Nocardia sp. NBC_00508]WUD65336.1 hypothetical protein OHA40_27485 [Nocardia sp. NBC_00508]
MNAAVDRLLRIRAGCRENGHAEPGATTSVSGARRRAAELVDAELTRFFVPPYAGHRGRLGVRPDRDEIVEIVPVGDRTVTSKRLSALLG